MIRRTTRHDGRMKDVSLPEARNWIASGMMSNCTDFACRDAYGKALLEHFVMGVALALELASFGLAVMDVPYHITLQIDIELDLELC